MADEITFSSGDIPVLKVEGRSLPEAWEKSLIEVWEKGIAIRTQYDRPSDPPSRDATMIMVIRNLFISCLFCFMHCQKTRIKPIKVKTADNTSL